MSGRQWAVTPSGDPHYRNSRCVERDCRPVVVIDPESLIRDNEADDGQKVWELVNCLRRIAEADGGERTWRARLVSRIADEVEKQLRAPRPAEPTGLGAVVEDVNGAKWIRSDDTDCANPWHQNGTFTDREYAEIDAVRVLSEGVLPGVEPLADWEIDLLRGAR